MKKNITIFPLLVLLAMAACTGNSTFERQLAVADSLMRHNYDSAYTLLKDMDSMAQHMPERLRMKHLLLRANAQNKAWEFFTSDSTGKTLTQYYDRKGTPNERMLAHYIKGCAYRDMGDEPMALQCFNEAAAAADTADTQCDFDQLSIIYGQIASIFKNRALPDEALEAYGMAERYAWRCNDTLRVLNIWSNKAEFLIEKGFIREALQLKEKTANHYRNLGDRRNAARLQYRRIEWYAKYGEFQKAKAAMEEYEAHSGYFQPNGDIKPGWEKYYHLKGNYYLEQYMLDSAIYFFQKLQQVNKRVHAQSLASSGLYHAYRRMGKTDSVAKHAILADSLYKIVYTETAAQNLQLGQALYNYANHQKVAQRKELEAKEAQLSRRNWIIGALSATFLLTLLALWLHRQVKNKQLKLKEASKEKERLRTEMEEKEQTIKWLKEQVEEKKIIINSLNETINQNAVDQQLNNQMQQTIGLLQKQVEEYERKINLHLMARKLNELLQNENIARVIKRGEERIGRPDAEEWKTIYALVEEFCPKFTEFKNNISIAEYQICVLLKLGCKLSDIGYLTGLDSNNLSVMRLRLLNKIFNTKEGGATMFDKRIREL